MPKSVKLSDGQIEIIKKLGHPLFTPEYIANWINRDDDVMINAPAALSAIEAKGFYEAVKAIENIEKGKEAISK